ITLPDGSKVWLNAESSITYPTTFVDKERKVEITGEAYFEVSHNAQQPFIVASAQQLVEVLGTEFNVNAYNDDHSINTTLLKGSVRIKTTSNQTTILTPGQQARVSNETIRVNDVQTEDYIAWKNGLIVLNHADLSSVVKQIERWYDVS